MILVAKMALSTEATRPLSVRALICKTSQSFTDIILADEGPSTDMGFQSCEPSLLIFRATIRLVDKDKANVTQGTNAEPRINMLTT
jgi:hypothetical protein